MSELAWHLFAGMSSECKYVIGIDEGDTHVSVHILKIIRHLTRGQCRDFSKGTERENRVTTLARQFCTQTLVIVCKYKTSQMIFLFRLIHYDTYRVAREELDCELVVPDCAGKERGRLLGLRRGLLQEVVVRLVIRWSWFALKCNKPVVDLSAYLSKG